MAHYLVTATPIKHRLKELGERLGSGEVRKMRPFGGSLDFSLRYARTVKDGAVVWEEEDYCSPPLAAERAAVLDRHFTDIEVKRVKEGEGWRQIADLPPLWESKAY